MTYCSRHTIENFALGYVNIDEYGNDDWYVEGCFNGYPYDKHSCVQRGDPKYGQIGENDQLDNDPLGPNCKVGGSTFLTPRCVICDTGYVLKTFEGDNQRCVPITTEPEGCLRANKSGGCASCNYYEGYLPTDSATSDCYKFDPNRAF